MAKKQTRKSLSISRECWEKAVELAKAQGVSLSSIVENYLRAEVGLPPVFTSWSMPGSRTKTGSRTIPTGVPFCTVHAIPTPCRFCAKVPRSPVKSPTLGDIAQQIAVKAEDLRIRTAEAEERAFANPCRRSTCRNKALHEAHEPEVRHGTE